MEKKIISLLLFFWGSFQLYGQSYTHTVYKISGSVCLKKGQQWQPVQKRDSLQLTDWFQIADGAEVHLLERATNRIYKNIRNGELRVIQLINDARQNADQIANQVNAEIAAELKLASSNNPSFARLGATMRGETEVGDTSEKIYHAIQQLLRSMEQGEAIGSNDTISLHKTPLPDGTFYYTIANKGEQPLCINLLSINKSTKECRLCFDWGYTYNEPYGFVPPKKTLSLDAFVFSPEKSEEVVFVLFGTPAPFDCKALNLLLKTASDQTGTAYESIFFSSLSN